MGSHNCFLIKTSTYDYKTILLSYVANMGDVKPMIEIVLGSFVTLGMKTQVMCFESSTHEPVFFFSFF